MARLKTTNTPDLAVLLEPTSPMSLAIEQAVLRNHKWSLTAVPVADRIAIRIAGAITMNLIQGGHRLLEKDLSEVLHVSRAPVREALRILERERLVEFRARHGAVVTAPDADDLRDIYVVRDALYQILLQQLLDERADDLCAVFERHMPSIAKAAEDGSVDEYTLQSFLLNLAMTDLSRNRVIVDLLTSVSLRTLRYVRMGLAANPDLLRISLGTWRALQQAVEQRDVAAVLGTARQRIAGSRDAAVRALSRASAGAEKMPGPDEPMPARNVRRRAQRAPARARPRTVSGRRPRSSRR
jgi:DNA-binding GntR family transcriptional regulator